MHAKGNNPEFVAAPGDFDPGAVTPPWQRAVPVTGSGAIESGQLWAVIQIGDGSLDYRVVEPDCCLCRAVGADAIAASIRLLGPYTETDAEGYPLWELRSGR